MMTFSNLELSYLEALTVGNKVVLLPRPDNGCESAGVTKYH